MPTQLNQVPEALQSDFDIVGDSGFFADPQQLFLDSLVKDPRDIVYTPHNGGHWLITSHELAREVLSNAELFGSFPIGIPANMEQRPRLIPLESDAKEHRRYRRLLLPIFEPTAVARLQSGRAAPAWRRRRWRPDGQHGQRAAQESHAPARFGKPPRPPHRRRVPS